jgi:hypothetical protein
MKKKCFQLFILTLVLFNCASEDATYRDDKYRNISLETKGFFEFNKDNSPSIKTVVGVDNIPLTLSNDYLQVYNYLNFLEGYSRSSIWLSESVLKPTGTNNGGNTISLAFNNDFKITNKSNKTYILNATNNIGEISINEFFIGSEFNVLNIKDEQMDAYAYYTASHKGALTIEIKVFKDSNKIDLLLKGGELRVNNRVYPHHYIGSFDEANDTINVINNINLKLVNIENFFQ